MCVQRGGALRTGVSQVLGQVGDLRDVHRSFESVPICGAAGKQVHRFRRLAQIENQIWPSPRVSLVEAIRSSLIGLSVPVYLAYYPPLST